MSPARISFRILTYSVELVPDNGTYHRRTNAKLTRVKTYQDAVPHQRLFNTRPFTGTTGILDTPSPKEERLCHPQYACGHLGSTY
ncbi:hypothetical protein E2C01_083204 [Portunus trituberculatus]|uniref:Uncharacterized protein n=1 Tax=Portunus trituberculatus TaxID=210409 RepID=A0A5B7J1C1_PORTR|nr:hypothetical protein [Portunus trituberculatus]